MTAKEAILTLTDLPGAEAEAVIRDGLSSYNFAQAGYRDQRPLSVLASDPDSGEDIGGLIGRTSMGLLFIDRFFPPESQRKRGLGSRLIKLAEDEGARRGCTRAVPFTVHFSGARFLSAPGLRGARPTRLGSARPHPVHHEQEARRLTLVFFPA
jgi:Acetyltransferase (GNAT) family